MISYPVILNANDVNRILSTVAFNLGKRKESMLSKTWLAFELLTQIEDCPILHEGINWWETLYALLDCKQGIP